MSQCFKKGKQQFSLYKGNYYSKIYKVINFNFKQVKDKIQFKKDSL